MVILFYVWFVPNRPLKDTEEVMKLFDYCWFKLQIFTKQQNLSKLPSFEANPENEIQEKKYQNLRFHAPLPSILGS